MDSNWLWQIFFGPVCQNEGLSESLTQPLQWLTLRCFELKVFFSVFFQSKQVISQMCVPFMPAVYRGSLEKASQLSKNINPKLSTGSCGLIQVFFIVSYAQFFQNIFISTRKLLNPTHPLQCFVLRVAVFLNVGELQLEEIWFHQKLQKLLSLSAPDIFIHLSLCSCLQKY